MKKHNVLTIIMWMFVTAYVLIIPQVFELDMFGMLAYWSSCAVLGGLCQIYKV